MQPQALMRSWSHYGTQAMVGGSTTVWPTNLHREGGMNIERSFTTDCAFDKSCRASSEPQLSLCRTHQSRYLRAGSAGFLTNDKLGCHGELASRIPKVNSTTNKDLRTLNRHRIPCTSDSGFGVADNERFLVREVRTGSKGRHRIGQLRVVRD